MNKKKYKLTISILASNRKDTLPKTLESLKPILDNVSSELIVVDTGCDEDLLEVVRQYTDKIYKFEWCKDFSKARNVGIDNAQGDWFMFIDDDEWFEDTTELIEFFNSDEMNKYNYAKYVVRNYTNMQGTGWSDSIAGRMFRLFEGTRFVDAIHEHPIQIAGPTKSFAAYAHHYGYVYKSEDERRAHVKRNTELLLEQVKKEPGNARHYCHITQEYNNINEYEKSMEYALEGIEKTDMSIRENMKDISGLYGTVVWLMLNQSRYEEALIKVEEYLAISHITELGMLALYGFGATAAYKLGEFAKSIEYAEKFFDMEKVFEEIPDLVYKQDTILITVCAAPENIERITGVAFASAVMSEDIHNMIKYSAKMKNGPKGLMDAEKCMKKLAEYIGVTAQYEQYAAILRKMVLNRDYFNILLAEVEIMKNENSEAFLNVADVMGLMDTNHGYVQFMNIISKRNSSDETLLSLYEKAINEINDIINLHHHFWSIAIQRQINIAGMVAKKPINQWMNTVDAWAKDVKIKEAFEKKQDISAVLDTDGVHMKYFDMVMVEYFMCRKKLEEISLDELKIEMARYSATVMEFYRMVYRDEVFVQYPTILPGRCQVALKFARILSEKVEDVRSEVDDIIKILPNVKALCEKYLELANA